MCSSVLNYETMDLLKSSNLLWQSNYRLLKKWISRFIPINRTQWYTLGGYLFILLNLSQSPRGLAPPPTQNSPKSTFKNYLTKSPKIHHKSNHNPHYINHYTHPPTHSIKPQLHKFTPITPNHNHQINTRKLSNPFLS